MYKLKNANLLPLLHEAVQTLQTVRHPPRLLIAVLGQQRYAVSTVQSHTTPERLPGGVFKQPGVTQRVAAAVPRVEISRADPVPHVSCSAHARAELQNRTVLGMHLVYSKPEMFKFKI